MSNTPIFDQLFAKFAEQGKRYEDFSRFSTPAFVWTSVDLTKRSQTVQGATPTVAQLDETMSMKVVKPIAVRTLQSRGTAA